MPDTAPAPATTAAPAGPPPAMHPMDPGRSNTLSPMFRAFLSWLLGHKPITSPVITNIAVSGNSVLAATDRNPLFNAHLGSLDDFEMNIRGWGEACGAEPAMIDGLVTRLRRAGL